MSAFTDLFTWKTNRFGTGIFGTDEVTAVPSSDSPAGDTSALKAAASAAARAEAERLRKRQGLKSTILTGSDQSLMTPAQTEKAQALG